LLRFKHKTQLLDIHARASCLSFTQFKIYDSPYSFFFRATRIVETPAERMLVEGRGYRATAE